MHASYNKYKQKERRTDINLGSVFCQFKDKNIMEYIIIKKDDDVYTLESSYTGQWFKVKKELCFETKDALKYNRFVKHCMNLLAGKLANGSKDPNTSFNIVGIGGLRLKKYLRNTKQTEYKDRFYLEYSEYLV